MAQLVSVEDIKNVALTLGWFEFILLLGSNQQQWNYPGLELEQLITAYNSELGRRNSKVEATILITILLDKEVTLRICFNALHGLSLDEPLYRAIAIKAFSLTKKHGMEWLLREFERNNFVVKGSIGKKTFLEITKELQQPAER
ncbi:hypothetical protein HN784_00545 [bacterium]|jgi:hypothetical protein|nr:hypothetical protein [bacterium]MBT4251569.1 hypothetical protein [bacterium]MBT4597618.1 hypothetical protein [bacterium]MBT6753632.1 hypothetical protein [bacterium]MBT7037769.1 hypothetical protein [bacterium]